MKKTAVFNKKPCNNIFFTLVTAVLFLFCHNADSKKPALSAPSGEQRAALQKSDTSTARNNIVSKAQSTPRKLVIYYFHGNVRCHSCTMIENLTKQAVNSGFAEQLKSGRIELKIVNVEESANEHFVKEYKLYTKSVILSDVKEGKEALWKNCEQVWTKLHSESDFMTYIQSEVKALL